MLPQNPVDMALGLPRQQLQWAQSLHKVLSSNIEHGVPTGKDTTGNWSEFDPGNLNGILIRVGASGSADNKYAWTVSGTGIAINHGLQRQPIGCHLVSANKQLSIWLPVTPDENIITIAPSDATAYATLYIF